MPINFGVNPDPLNIQPRIIVDPAETERYHLQSLIQAAQLKNLQAEGNFKQQGLDLERAGLGETTRYHSALSDEANANLAESIRAHKAEELYRNAGLQVTQRGQDLESAGQQRGQDITIRGQDLGQASAAAQNASQERIAQIGHLAGLVGLGGSQGITAQDYAAAIGEAGAPALQHVLAAKKLNEDAAKTAKSLQSIMALQKAGKNDAVKTVIGQIQANDPEQWNQLKEHLAPELQKPVDNTQNQGVFDYLSDGLGHLFGG